MMDFTTLCKLKNAIRPATWKSINQRLAEQAVRAASLTGEALRLDTTGDEHPLADRLHAALGRLPPARPGHRAGAHVRPRLGRERTASPPACQARGTGDYAPSRAPRRGCAGP